MAGTTAVGVGGEGIAGTTVAASVCEFVVSAASTGAGATGKEDADTPSLPEAWSASGRSAAAGTGDDGGSAVCAGSVDGTFEIRPSAGTEAGRGVA